LFAGFSQQTLKPIKNAGIQPHYKIAARIGIFAIINSRRQQLIGSIRVKGCLSGSKKRKNLPGDDVLQFAVVAKTGEWLSACHWAI